jgi:hypothetical protein
VFVAGKRLELRRAGAVRLAIALLQSASRDVALSAALLLANMTDEGKAFSTALSLLLLKRDSYSPALFLQNVCALFAYVCCAVVFRSADEDVQTEVMESGGLIPLVALLRSAHAETVHYAAAAIANCASNGILFLPFSFFAVLVVVPEESCDGYVHPVLSFVRLTGVM